MKEEELKILVNELRSFEAETEWVEFKTNNSEKLGEYIAALSNSACLKNEPFGYLVFGIEDKTHRIVGTTFTIHQKIKGNEDLIPYLSRYLEPRIHFEYHELEMEGSKVALFKITATRNTPVSFMGKKFIRIGPHKQNLKDYPEKERLIWGNAKSIVFENEVTLTGLTGEDITSLLYYPAYFDLMGLPIPTNQRAILNKLSQEGLIQVANEEYSITNLGAILFAKDLDSFPSIKRKSVRIIVYKGKNKMKTFKETEGRKGYAVDFQGMIDYIDDQLPRAEIIEKSLRKDNRIYPKLAIREIVANAIIHQDFSEIGTSPMVEIYSDRIEVSNPGKSLIPTLRFVDHNPQSRNEQLARLMRRLGICEERGSGIDKVVFQCELFHLPAPKFISDSNYTKATLYAPKSLRQMDRIEKIRACYLHSCLRAVSGEGYMSNSSLRKRLGIKDSNYPIASRIISDTLKDGLIKEHDPDSRSKRNAKYIPFWA